VHITEMLDLLRRDVNNTIDFENVEHMNDTTCRYWTGLTVLNFLSILTCKPQLSNICKKPKTALGMYLIKIRTGEPFRRIASLFRLSTYTVCQYVKKTQNNDIGLLTSLGFSVHKPETLDVGETQLFTIKANKSRLVTLCRWVIELVNGRFKRDFKGSPLILNENRSTVPLVFVLCTNKDKTTYNKIFDLINEYFCDNDIVINVKYCMMDFEITAIQCARQNLENIMVKCCSFHFGQIIYRKIQSSGLAKLYGTDYSFSLEIKCLMALSFLPHSTIPQYFKVWEENCSEKSALIAKWFAENYVVGKNGKLPQIPPSLWSCHDLNHLKLPRTQNNVEAWHHRLNSIVDKRSPGFYELSTILLAEMNIVEGKIQCILNGEPSAKQKKICTKKNVNIETILRNFEMYTELDLLKAIATSRNLMSDFRICAAILNDFHPLIIDRSDAQAILDRAMQRLNLPNYLGDYVLEHQLNRRQASFIRIDDARLPQINIFPVMEMSDLIFFSIGVYQIKQARSYYGEHIRANGTFSVEISENLEITDVPGITSSHETVLLRGRIRSRHQSNK
ncbi:hypothetical protein HW555_000456, partial [Spodoptera exigua]